MRIYRIISVAIGSVLLSSVSTSAFAACQGSRIYCKPRPAPVAYAPSFAQTSFVQTVRYEGVRNIRCAQPRQITRQINCNPGFNVIPSNADTYGPVNVYRTNPFGHLKTIQYKNSPNVNIMQVRSRAPLVRLADRPVAYTKGCNPTARVYCRPSGGVPVNVVFNNPVAPVHAPIITPPVRQIVSGSFTQPLAGGGDYWEKVSGPTVIGGFAATQIICRRQAPRPAPVRVQVVRPVIGVPVAVPTPICAPRAVPACAQGFRCGPQPVHANRYNNPYSNPWGR